MLRLPQNQHKVLKRVYDMRSTANIAVVQLCSSAKVDISLRQLDDLLGTIQSGSVSAIFLPENFAALAAEDPRAIGESEAAGRREISNYIADQARTLKAYIFAGTLPIASRPDNWPVAKPRVRAASLVYDTGGHLVARYDKQHLFDADVQDGQGRYRESDTFEAGDDLVVVDTTFGKVGLSVCYDVRYPEMYTALTTLGAQIFAVPSAFTQVTGAAHFEVLIRARAIENACFVVAACQSGGHDSGRQTFGHSQIISPWGEVLVSLPDGPGVITQRLDFSLLDQARAAIPAWHRPSLNDQKFA